MMVRSLFIGVAFAVLLSHSAYGRDASGQLQDILLPHSGAPEVLTARGAMEIVLAEPGDLVLENGDRRYALSGQWRDLPGGRVGALVRLPADIVAGRYALAYADGRDRNRAAVFVVDEMTEVYAVAHLAGPRLSGREGSDNSGAESALEQALAANVALVLMSGPLSAEHSPDDFKALIAWIESQPVPVFVTPGSLERRGPLWRRYFGTPVKGFRFGPDGYMALGLLDAYGAGELDGDMGAIQRLRRALKPQRWVVGFTGVQVFQWGMRSQLTLFADDPIDGLLLGASHTAGAETAPAFPWQETLLLRAPSAASGALQIIDMTHAAILPRPATAAPDTDDASTTGEAEGLSEAP